MEYLNGELKLIYNLVLSDLKLSILDASGAQGDRGRYVDLGKRRRLWVGSEPYLLWWWDEKVEWEPIPPEAFKEQADGEKVFKLLTDLKATGIAARSAKKDPDDRIWDGGWKRLVTSGSATISHEGFIFSRSVWMDGWEYKWYIGYAHRGLRVGGKSILALYTPSWVLEEIFYNEEAIAFFKETFEKPMDFSPEEFDEKLNQIGLEKNKPWIKLRYWPEDA